MQKPDWTKISSIAELVSSVAVLATLIYLAIQTQQNTAAVQSGSRQETLNAEVDLIYELMDRPFVIEYWRSEKAAGDLTPAQNIEVELAGTAYFRMRENLWLQYQNDVIDFDTWQTYRDILVGTLADSDVLRNQWDRFGERDQFVDGFYEAINEQLRAGAAMRGTLVDSADD